MLNKMIMATQSICQTIKFYVLNLISRRNLNGADEEIVVSLTTYSKRVGTVFITIESIFAQSYPPGRVILWLSEEEHLEIPASLVRLKSRGLDIRFCSGNLRSYKKASYANEYFNSHIIITADDDIIYPSNWLNGLVSEFKNNMNCVICYRGHDIIINNGVIESYSSFLDQKKWSSTPSKLLIPTGCSGVLYPPGSLSELASSQNSKLFMTLAPDADDLWYKCVALSNGFYSKRVAPNNIHFPPILTSLGDGLFHKNVHGHENDIKLKACIKFFGLFKAELE